MVICVERGADLHTVQLMPLPLTVSCFSKIQIGFTFLVLAHPGSPGKGPLNGCVCVCVVKTNLRNSFTGKFSGKFVVKCFDAVGWATGSNFIKQHAETVMV